jgi:hypothetical protein
MRPLCTALLVAGFAAVSAGPVPAQAEKERPLRDLLGRRGDARPAAGNQGLRSSAQPEYLVANAGVQAELKMTPEQIARAAPIASRMFQKHVRDYMSLLNLDPNSSTEKGHEIHTAAARETLTALADVLKPEQVKRLKQIYLQQLKQIYLQQMSVYAFLDYEVQRSLPLDEEQKTKVRALCAETNEKYRRDVASLPGGERRQKLLDALRKDSTEKALALLTDDQKQNWKDLVGDPVEVKATETGLRGLLKR